MHLCKTLAFMNFRTIRAKLTNDDEMEVSLVATTMIWIVADCCWIQRSVNEKFFVVVVAAAVGEIQSEQFASNDKSTWSGREIMYKSVGRIHLDQSVANLRPKRRRRRRRTSFETPNEKISRKKQVDWRRRRPVKNNQVSALHGWKVQQVAIFERLEI